jgi:hypothetical protein
MSSRGSKHRRSGRASHAAPNDLWKAMPELPPVEPIVPAADPTAMVRSLGSLPLVGQGQAGDHYVAAVVKRAAGLATALAAAADVLALPGD